MTIKSTVTCSKCGEAVALEQNSGITPSPCPLCQEPLPPPSPSMVAPTTTDPWDFLVKKEPDWDEF